jgi:hemerythrin
MILKRNNEFSVDIRDVDRRHKHFFEIITKIQTLINYQTDFETMNFSIDVLLNYINLQFIREEKIMEENNYPDLEQHKKIHYELKTGLMNFLNKLNLEKHFEKDKFFYFLNEWRTEHVMKMDRKFGNFLENNFSEACR